MVVEHTERYRRTTSRSNYQYCSYTAVFRYCCTWVRHTTVSRTNLSFLAHTVSVLKSLKDTSYVGSNYGTDIPHRWALNGVGNATSCYRTGDDRLQQAHHSHTSISDALKERTHRVIWSIHVVVQQYIQVGLLHLFLQILQNKTLVFYIFMLICFHWLFQTQWRCLEAACAVREAYQLSLSDVHVDRRIKQSRSAIDFPQTYRHNSSRASCESFAMYWYGWVTLNINMSDTVPHIAKTTIWRSYLDVGIQ